MTFPRPSTVAIISKIRTRNRLSEDPYTYNWNIYRQNVHISWGECWCIQTPKNNRYHRSRSGNKFKVFAGKLIKSCVRDNDLGEGWYLQSSTTCKWHMFGVWDIESKGTEIMPWVFIPPIMFDTTSCFTLGICVPGSNPAQILINEEDTHGRQTLVSVWTMSKWSLLHQFYSWMHALNQKVKFSLNSEFTKMTTSA